MREKDVKKLSLALTSKERWAVYKKHISEVPKSTENIDKWMQVNSLIREGSFEERLNIEGISKYEYNYSIKNMDEQDYEYMYEALKEMEWYQYYIKVMERFAKQSVDDMEDMTTITSAYRPFTLFARVEIESLFKKLKNVIISEKLIDNLIYYFKVELKKIYLKTITWDLTVEREKNSLIGNTSDERFISFMSKNFSSIESIWDYYLKYPVLTRLATTRTCYFVNFIEEALTRLDNNYSEIRKIINEKSTGEIKDIKCCFGDSHQKGHSVIVFTFSNEEKVVYKPRNLKIAQKFNKFISWINENGNLLDLAVTTGIYHDEYSFEKFITYESCHRQEEIKNFYKRFGQLIAIAYTLCGNDFHFENIIAHGEYPVIIDLETLIQPIIPRTYSDMATTTVKVFQNNETIMGTALMPLVAFVKDGKGVDISALNAKKQKLPYKLLIPSNINTDNMKYELKEYIFEGANNLPKLNGENCDFKKHSSSIIEGFRNAMSFFYQKKLYLLSENSVLNEFNGVIVRNVIKPTAKYGSLLEYSTHPNYSTDMLKREKLLENMWAYPYKNKEVILYEFNDMMFNDIPIFFSSTDRRDIICGGGFVINNFFSKTGIDRVKARIRELTKEVINKQEAYMTVSFGKYELTETKIIRQNKKEATRLNFDLVEEAEKIAKQLEQSAVYSRTGREISWNDVTKNSNGDWEISAIGPNLYNGTAGIAFFFFELYKVTKKQKYFNFYQLALRSAISDTVADKTISPYMGKISLMYPILNEYAFNGESVFLHLTEEIWSIINHRKKDILSIDWLSGMAGIIALLITAFRILGQNKYLMLANSIGEELINKISEFRLGDLNVGMAHGFSGIALSLAKLGAETMNQEFTGTAYYLWEREKKHLQAQGYKENYKWCNGLAGVLSAKTHMLEYVNNYDFIKDIEESMKAITGNIKNNDCLCHGNMGDMEFLFSLNQQNGRKLYNNIIQAKLNEIYRQKVENKRYSVRSIPGFTSIDLFTGITGVGYGFLRAYAPSIISNVNCLDICSGINR